MGLDKKTTEDKRDSDAAKDAFTGEGGAWPAAVGAQAPSGPLDEALASASRSALVGEVIRRFRRGRWTLTQALR
ncbi:MAG TPA: hypothetical protein VHQ87_05155 [Rhizobacter sp.]|nr:hypothetical protein [Rhizobacter sp.]